MTYEKFPIGTVADRGTYFDKEVEYGGEQEVALHQLIWHKVTQEFEQVGESPTSTWSTDDSHIMLEDGDALTYISVGPDSKLRHSSVKVRAVKIYVSSPDFQGAISLSIPFDEEGNVTQFPQTDHTKRITYSDQPCYIAGPDLQIQLHRDQDTARILPAKDWEGPEVNYTPAMKELTEAATPESIVGGILDHANGTICRAESDFRGQDVKNLMRLALREIYKQVMFVVIDPSAGSGKVAVLMFPTPEQVRTSSSLCVAEHMDYGDALSMTYRHWEKIWHPKTFSDFGKLCERIRALKKDTTDI